MTNTLGAINHKGALPGEEMYMSGRALFPLSINVAAVLSREFNGELPISYSAGQASLTFARFLTPASGQSPWPPICSSPAVIYA
ncbi:putative selenate reductase subunit YgfK [Serratia fonticola]|uniref:Putative selenate reductase subunit YgfK n=1 Tax=Serratia fonticola TaxID=47917 RepID=A0A4U9ULV7_SERFO|nr:putative selenate reductase subunit YgfK [Serratia fonticola]